MQASAVNQYQHIGIAQSVHLQPTAHVVLAEIERSSQSTQDILNALTSILLQLSTTDHLGLHGRIF